MSKFTVARPYGGACTKAFGDAEGDRWSYRGRKLVALAHGVEDRSTGMVYAHRRRAEEAVDEDLDGSAA